MRKFLLPIVLLALSSCAPHLYPDTKSFMTAKKLEEPKVERFPHCQNYGCAVVKNIELNKRDWKQIDKVFGKKAKTAEAEREKIARTIGIFEKIVGPITGTENDKPGTFEQTGPGQLDCVDESTNTTIYMILLNQKGLLKFHTVEQPQVRYPLVSGRGWMHQTAVVRETKTGAEYAIDSWFDEPGHTARIVPIDAWMAGWTPEKAKEQAETARQ